MPAVRESQYDTVGDQGLGMVRHTGWHIAWVRHIIRVIYDTGGKLCLP